MTSELHPFLAQLAAHGAYEAPSWPARAPNGSAGHTPAAGDPQAARYASAALDSEAGRVAEASEGTRNDTLNRAAYRMAQLVANGWLAGQDVYDTLLGAAQAAGLGYAEAEATIQSGLSAPAGGRAGVELRPDVAPAQVISVSGELPGGETPASSHDTGSSSEEPERPRQIIDGGSFIHSAATQVPALWGSDDDVLWAEGEPLIITGPTGVGKTTLGTHVLAARMGLLNEDVLGYPVTPGRKRTLVLAMDRPRQIQRAMARLLRQYPGEALDDRLVVWQGPPPMDLGKHPHVLHQLAEMAGADTVVIDSLKDAAIKLSDEETGQGLSRAMNYCVTEGIQVLAYHHQTKRSNNPNSKPNTIADVYGSSWITAGAGSVLLVWGNSGDLVVELSHLKQPSDVVGPLAVGFDHTAGRAFLYDGLSERDRLLDLLAAGPQTAITVASWLAPGTPDRAAIAKARRRLERLVEAGRVVHMDGPAPGDRGTDGRLQGREASRYALAGRPAIQAGSPKNAPKHEVLGPSTWDDESPGRTVNRESEEVDQSTEGTRHKHAEGTPTVNPQVAPKMNRSTPAPPATEARTRPPFKGGRAAGTHAYAREGDQSHPTELEVEVCARCYQPAERFISAPGGKRWCPRCAYPTEHQDHEQED